MERSVSVFVTVLAWLLVLVSVGGAITAWLAMSNSPDIQTAKQRAFNGALEQTALALRPDSVRVLADVTARRDLLVDTAVNEIASQAFDQLSSALQKNADDLDNQHTVYDEIKQGLAELGYAVDVISSDQGQELPQSYPEISYAPDMKGYFYEYGEYLAGECTGCHKVSDEFTGIPAIFGLAESHFVGRLNDYASGVVENAAMAMVARNLDDEMKLSLAIYFKEQKPG